MTTLSLSPDSWSGLLAVLELISAGELERVAVNREYARLLLRAHGI